MPSGRTFALAIVEFILTVFSLGIIPVLSKGALGGSLPFVIELPYFDTNLLLGLAVFAGSLTFVEKLASENNPRLGGFYGIIRYIVSIYYTVTIFAMLSTIVIPAYNVTIQTVFLFLGTLIVLSIVINLIGLMIKISVPGEFEKKGKTLKSKSTSKKETIAS